MNWRTTDMREVITLALVCLATSSPLLAADYRFEKIRVPRSLETEVHGINARGDIVGRYDDRDGVSHGFLLRQGVFTAIDVPGATASLAARGINARGDVVGNVVEADLARHGYLLSDGLFTQIAYPGASGTMISGINNAGDITGLWVDALGEGSGFIRKDGRFRDVRISGGLFEIVNVAQDNGRVLVGSVVMEADGEAHGFIRERPGRVELIDYPDPSVGCTGVRWINQRGDMVGSFTVGDEGCDPPSFGSHGFLLRAGEFTVIDFPGASGTEARAINDDGVIVGRYLNMNGRLWGFRAVPIETSNPD